MRIDYRRYRMGEKAFYRPDPEHKNKPKEGTWYETPKGWTNVKPKVKKQDAEKPSASEPPVHEDVLEEKKAEASKSISDYYGEIDTEEKKKIEEESAKRIVDYIQKVAKGETADLPELSDDDKERFIQSMFIVLKAKQIESIPAATEELGKQRNEVVKALLEHASNGLSSVIESLSTKSMVEKNIGMNDPSELFELPKSSEKDVKEMDDKELSEHLLLEGKRDFKKQFLKKPSMRGKNFDDLPKDYRDKANHLAETAAIYGKNFKVFNPRLNKSVKVKKTLSGVGFVLGEYKETPDSYYSDITLPVDSMAFDKIPMALNDMIKTLGASGFRGRIEMSTVGENIALNKNNIRIITDDPRYLYAANSIAKEAFKKEGVDVKAQIVKKQFGMTEDEQFDYQSKLKMLALRAKKTKKIALPPSDLQNYLIAARLSGYDLVPDKDRFILRKHDAGSAIGKMRLNVHDDPRESFKRLNEAFEQEKKPFKEKQEEIPIEDPFEQMRLIQQGLRDKNRDVKDEIDQKYSDDFDNPRLLSVMKKRRNKTTPSIEEPINDDTVETTEVQSVTEPSKPAFADSLKSLVSSIDEKAKAKDASVLSDFETLLQKMQEDLDAGNADAFTLKQYQKAVNMSAASLLGGGFTSKMSTELGKKFEDINNSLKKALVPPLPKTAEELNLDSFGGHAEVSLSDADKDRLSDKEIMGNDGYPSNWLSDGKDVYSSDFKHKMTFETEALANKFAKSHPYLNPDKHIPIDPVDEDEALLNSEDLKSGKKLDVSEIPDTSRLSGFTERYKIPEESPAMRELLGFKRLILKNIGNEDRLKIRENGLGNYLSSQAPKKLQQDFIDRMDEKDFQGDDFDSTKKAFALIDPSDFAKMVSLIGKSKTACVNYERKSFKILSDEKIEEIADRIKIDKCQHI